MLTKTTMQSRGKRGRSNSSSTARFVRRKTNIEFLPDELLFDILVRLPAVFLHGRARLVCHKWIQIIHSRDFINAHFQQHSTYGLVLSQSKYRHPHSTFMTATQDGRIETSELTNSYISMATSCNGLTLQLRCDNAQVRGFSLHVINPATDQSFRLPSIVFRKREVYGKQCGIAYSAASRECKVTLPYYDVFRQSAFLDIVTVGVDASWRRVAIPKFLPTHVFSSFLELPVCSEGFLHWGEGRYCLTMNVETEIITMTEFPFTHDQYQYRYSYDYLSTGTDLTLLIGRGDLPWEVWEMRPAESGEWRKAGLPKIQLEARLNPIGWVKYPEVLAFAGIGETKCIVFYNLETHEINMTDLPYHLHRYNNAVVHRSSLARPIQD